LGVLRGEPAAVVVVVVLVAAVVMAVTVVTAMAPMMPMTPMSTCQPDSYGQVLPHGDRWRQVLMPKGLTSQRAERALKVSAGGSLSL
jgi:hypothetical protein